MKKNIDMQMFCVHILNKHFQLLVRIESDKNIINLPPVNGFTMGSYRETI